MRKVLFTESQIKSLLGEDIMPYLNKGCDVPGNTYGTEVATTDKDMDGEFGREPTEDEIANSRTATNPLFRNRYHAGLSESKKKSLNEANKDIVDKKIKFTPNLIMDLNNALANAQKQGNATGYKRLVNLVKNKEVTTNDAYRILDDYEDVSYDKQSIIPSSVITYLRHKLGNMTFMSKTQKETKKNMGMENAYQKAGGTKTSGNGMAHTQKNNNGVTFTYQN